MAISGFPIATTPLGAVAAPIIPGVESIDAYGADPTGTADSTAAFAAALAALPTDATHGYNVGIIQLGAGIYRFDTPTAAIGPGCYIQGVSRGATIVDFRGTGDCFRLFSSWMPSDSYNAPIESQYNAGGGVRGLTIDGTNAGPGSSGIHYGDGIEQEIDVIIRNFDGVGDIGLWQDNTISWTEKANVRVHLINNTRNFVAQVNLGGTVDIAADVTLPSATIELTADVWDPTWPRPVGDGGGSIPQIYVNGQVVRFSGYTVNGDGTCTLTGCTLGSGSLTAGMTARFGSAGASCAYNTFDVRLAAEEDQDGFVLENGANFYSGQITIRGNFTTSPDPATNAALRLTGSAPTGTRLAGNKSLMQFCRLDVQVEQSGGNANWPQTIVLDAGNPINSCFGILRFGGPNWLPCNIALASVGRMQFMGFIVGDVNLNPAGTSYMPKVAGAMVGQQANANPGTGALNLGDGDYFTMTIGANRTISTTGLIPAGPQRKTLVVKQNPTGGFTLTWPSEFKFPGGTPPTLTPAANAVDVYEMSTIDGATWYVNAVQDVK